LIPFFCLFHEGPQRMSEENTGGNSINPHSMSIIVTKGSLARISHSLVKI